MRRRAMSAARSAQIWCATSAGSGRRAGFLLRRRAATKMNKSSWPHIFHVLICYRDYVGVSLVLERDLHMWVVLKLSVKCDQRTVVNSCSRHDDLIRGIAMKYARQLR